MSAPLKTIQEALRKASGVPSYKGAQILSDPYATRVELVLTSSISDLTRNKKRSIRTHVSFARTASGAVEEASKIQYSFEEKDEVIMSAAHEGVDSHRIVFRSCEGDKGNSDKRLFVEWWSGIAMLQSIEVTKYHGAFNADSTFGRISFHPARHSLVAYIAEAKVPEDETHSKYEYKDDWGSTLEGKSDPVVVTLDFRAEWRGDGNRSSTALGNTDETPEGKVIVLTGPPNTALGEVVFGPGDDEVTFVATETMPRRYGLAVCFNRRSSIYCSKFDGSEMRCLTNDVEHARSPHYTSQGHLIPMFNLQENGAELRKLKFAGVYTGEGLIYSSEERIYFDTQFRSTTRVIEADLGSQEINVLNPDDAHNSWTIIGVGKEQLVLAKHDIHGEIELRHYRLNDHHRTTFLYRPTPRDVITTSIISDAKRPFVESIFLAPKQPIDKLFSSANGKPPLIIIPHGGPHAAYSTAYSAYHAALVSLGAAVLRVNYTGSTGFGSDSIDRLVGRIGTDDVEDVHHAVTALKNSSAVFDHDRICVMGGSHGGFIGAWLLGRYPDAYKCGILLNPVINLGTVGAGSDIPDWAVSESIRPPDKSTNSYDLAHPPLLTADIYDKLWAASPMSVADKVKSPVCMILGGKDKRVPNYEGRNYVHYLQGRGLKNVKCYMFPEDGHALDSGDAYRGVFEAVGTFLEEHL